MAVTEAHISRRVLDNNDSNENYVVTVSDKYNENDSSYMVLRNIAVLFNEFKETIEKALKITLTEN